MEILIKNECTQVANYQLNYEEIKNYLAQELEKYKKLTVTPEYMSMAKESRAELNKMKKELSTRLSEIRTKQLAPYNAFKTQYIDKLQDMIDEQLVKIDEQIKEIEKRNAEQKAEEIKQYFDQKNKENNLEIPLNQVFNSRWTNVSYSMSKITKEIDVFFGKVTEDLSIIESFDKDFIIPLRKLYLACFDMSTVMRNKVEFDREKQKRLEAEAEAERLREEIEKEQKLREEMEKKAEELQDDLSAEEDEALENIPEDNLNAENDTPAVAELEIEEIPEAPEAEIEEIPEKVEETEVEKEKISFWVLVTPEQKKLMRDFVISNKIKCGKNHEKTTEDITAILLKHLGNGIYCDSCSEGGLGTNRCEQCDRKAMMWNLSEANALEIAKEIKE